MKINVKNLGIIGKGSVDVSKPLIVMCGANSTGKTYLSYLLYSIFSNKYKVLPPCVDEILISINETGGFDIKKEYIADFLKYEAEAVKQNIGASFALSDSEASKMFRYFSLSMEQSDAEFDKIIKRTSIKFSLNHKKDDLKFTLKKEPGSTHVECIMEYSGDKKLFSDLDIADFAIYTILRQLAHAPIYMARMLTVERNSIYTFNKELSISRNELIDTLLELQDEDKDNNIMSLLGQKSRRYPVAINDSLRVANDLSTIQKETKDFYDIATKIEHELLHGCILANQNGDVEFVPDSDAKRPHTLPIHLTSSIVKTLSSLIFYLKHLANKNDLVIIDEPEMNLHPDNQIVLARIFARLVNEGLRMIISTHSDYIIREFNNLIMLHSLSKTELGSIIEKRHYDRKEILNPNKLEVLYFSFGKKGKVEITPIEADKYGFNVPSIDTAIETQNKNTQYLFDTLTYGEQDD